MATLYWVGGTGTWDYIDKTHWATSSGGTGGAAIPTPVDDVIFDDNSDTGTIFTVTCSGPSECLNFSTSSLQYTMTFAGSGTLAVYGSMTLPATLFTRTYTGAIRFQSTSTGNTITTNGVTLASSLTFIGVGGEWTLGSAITTTAFIAVSAGAFISGNFATTSSQLASGALGIRSITLGSSTVTTTLNNQNAVLLPATNLTFNAGTSTIVISGASGGIITSGVTFYNVSFTATTNGISVISGDSIFNNLSITAPATAGVRAIQLSGNQIINGTLTLAGASYIRRIILRTDIAYTQRTIKIAAKSATNYVDFQGILVDPTGAVPSISGGSIGDCGNNTNITADTPKTVYWNLTGAQNWSATAWATTAGGTPNIANFPLAQDTATFTNTGAATTVTINGPWNTGTLTTATRTTAMTLNGASISTIHGDLTLSTGITFAVSGGFIFAGNTTQNITPAGKTVVMLRINKGTGNVVLQGDVTNTTTLTMYAGGFDTNNFNYTGTTFARSGTDNIAMSFGSSTVTLSATSPITFSNGTNLTFTAGTSTFVMSNVTLNTISADNISFYNLTITSPTAPNNKSVLLNTDVTVSNLLTVSGAVANARTHIICIQVITSSYTIRNISAGSVSLAQVDFIGITAAGAAASPNWTGTNLGDGGNNSNITFATPKTVYWNLSGARNWSDTAWATTSGGTAATANTPLPQDTCVIDNTGAATTITFNQNYAIGTLDMSARTSAVTVGITTGPYVIGNWINGSGVTLTGVSTTYFVGASTQSITSAGKTFGCAFSVNKLSVAVQLADAFVSTSSLEIRSGEFNANNFNVTVSNVSVVASINANVVNMGSGLWTLTGTGSVWNTPSTTLTLNKDTADILLSSTATTARTFAGNGNTYNKLTIGGTTGTSTLTVTGSNTFSEIASTKTVAHTLLFAGGSTTTTTAFSVTGTAGNLVDIRSNITTQATLVKIIPWYVGDNSDDNWDNTGLTFAAGGSIDYLVFSYIIGAISTELVTETTTLSELITALLISVNSVSESTTISDAQLGTLDTSNSISETETLTNTQTAIAIYPSTISETETLTDAQTSLAIYLNNISETETLTDAQTALAIYPNAISETETLTNTQTGLAIFPSVIAETETLTNTQVGTLTIATTISESETITDAIIGGLLLVGSISETETLTEVQSALFNLVGVVSETETLTNTQTGLAIYPSVIAETETLTNTQTGVAIFPKAVSETVTLSETQTGGFLFASTIIETETLTEVQSALFNLVGVISETETLTNTQTALAIYPSVIAETETLTNTQTALAIYPSTISETETITDEQSSLAVYPSTISETETLTDVQTGQRSILFTVTETTTLTNTQSATYTFVGNISELETLTDSQSSLAIYPSTVTESQVITEEQLGFMIYPSAVSESQAVTDAYNGQRSLYYAVTETTTLTNTQSATYLFAGNIVESVDFTTTQDALAVFRSTQIESMLITDSSFGRGWFKIIDAQTAEWNPIDDTQAQTWSIINDNQSSGWIPVNDNQ